jgi:hypothetical protein
MKLLITCLCLVALGCGGAVSTLDDHKAPIFNTCKGSNNVFANSKYPWLATKPEIRIVFWGTGWLTTEANQLADMTVAWTALANDPRFYSGMSEYGIDSGSLKGTYISNPNIASGAISESDIQTELQKEIADGSLPSFDRNSIFVIEMPPGSVSKYDNDNGFGAHHASVSGINYAVIDYDQDGIMNVNTSHEIYEACTNPDGSGFYGAGGGETEIGDYCANSTYELDGYTIQTLWGQKECACIH